MHWRLISTGVLLALLSGCATLRVDPSRVVVRIQPVTIACSDTPADIPVLIDLRNEGWHVLKIRIDELKVPPHELSWLYYDLLIDPARRGDWKHGPGGHGPIGTTSVRIGGGDSTTLKVVLYAIGPEDHDRSFRIRFEDREGNFYTTEAFKPCVAKE